MTDREAEAAGSATSDPMLAELWGDVVDLRHLAAAMAIDAVVSVGCFASARRMLAGRSGPATLSHAYAMLAGLVGCVAGGVICAMLFKPKRVLMRDDDAASRVELARLLDAGAGAPPSPAVAREMRGLGLIAGGSPDAGRT